MKKLLLVGVAIGFYALAQAQTAPSGSSTNPSGNMDSSSSSSSTDQSGKNGMDAHSKKNSQKMQFKGHAIDSSDMQKEESSDYMNSGDGSATTPSTTPKTSP